MDSWLQEAGDETSNASAATADRSPRESSDGEEFAEDENETNVFTGVSKTGVCGERNMNAGAGGGGELSTRVEAATAYASSTGTLLEAGPPTALEIPEVLASRGRAGTGKDRLGYSSRYILLR